jgi:hypothetical protein
VLHSMLDLGTSRGTCGVIILDPRSPGSIRHSTSVMCIPGFLLDHYGDLRICLVSETLGGG